MALTRVRVKLNGTWTTLTYNSATGRYEGDLSASGTSANLPGGYYNVEVEATGSAGTTTSLSGTAYRGLRLVVRETAAPTLTLVSPPAGYINTQRPTATLTASDEAGGSGIDPDSFAVSVDGTAQTEGLSTAAASGGTQLTWTAAADLPEGPHIVKFSVSDRDGNTTTVSAVYTVDVTPPELALKLPDTHRVVDSETIPVAGRTRDGISGPPSVVITVNGVARWSSQPPAEPGESLEFAADIPLFIAANDIKVTATDGAGMVSTEEFRVIRLVTDRAREDLEKLQDLYARGLDGWTAAEKAWFASTLCHRGGYDGLDVNRVELATDWIGTWMHGYGYFESWGPALEWPPDGALRLFDGERYLGRVEALRGALTPPEGTPDTPETMRALLTLQGANDLETILVAVDSLRPLLERSWWYSDEIFCGEV